MNVNLKQSLTDLSVMPVLRSGDSVSAAVSSVKGSHEGALVYDENNRFRGIFFPFHALYDKRTFTDRPIGTMLFSPPKISSDSDVWDVIQAMIDYHLYTIPVFDGSGKPVHVITARSLLKEMTRGDGVLDSLVRSIRVDEPYIVNESSGIRDVYTLIRKHGRSRVVVVSGEDKVTGILGRWDIYLALLSPAPGHRLGKQGGRMPASYFDRDWPKKLDYPVKTFMARPVATISDVEQMPRILKDLLASPKNSLVLTDRNVRPTGIVSTRSVLLALRQQRPVAEIPITVVDRREVISAFRKQEIEAMLKKFTDRLDRRVDVTDVTLIVEAVMNPANKAKQYELTLDITPVNGARMDARTKSFSLRRGVNDVQSKLFRRIDN